MSIVEKVRTALRNKPNTTAKEISVALNIKVGLVRIAMNRLKKAQQS
ncbi:hypothetical protein HO639_01160 [Streptococcus suis]|uniref:Uncharacterized protein n=1 Tax=Streptococcus suis TaxID=1307 RepID=A0A0Z8B9L5_STRSU|nr:hypothetical protein [Streptococcus suis]QBX21392.1 hypothetical protein Javan573_0005 [Streptococcus phage Javan573]NQH67513.1 hypothetical protein [Streptococcus suis]NQI05520.1 hypothetical protein [Streptococcus suis]NQP43210.1 hypothetical protein [Streptococcus suis]CYU02838.1 Uncharacterised protein [Streptococcus suis]